MPGLLGETSPNQPIESHAGYTKRGGTYVTEASLQQKSRSLTVSTGEEAGLGLKPGSCNGGTRPVEWKSGRAPRGALEHWVFRAHKGGGPTHIGVLMESLSKCSDLWFEAFQGPHKGSCSPHYLNISIALDKTVMNDSDFVLDCQRRPKSPLCSCSIQLWTLISRTLQVRCVDKTFIDKKCNYSKWLNSGC